MAEQPKKVKEQNNDFVLIQQADEGRKDKNQSVSKSNNNDNVSRGVSGIMSSASSTLKGTRWSFGQNLESSGQHLFMPLDSVKLKYTIKELRSSSAFGDTFVVSIRSDSNQSQSFQGMNFQAEPEENRDMFCMYSVQKSKFNKKERTYFLKKASLMMNFESTIRGIGKLVKLYMSNNNNFLIFKQ